MNLLVEKNKLDKKLKKIERELAVSQSKNSEQLRKDRARNLIKLGALFEISELTKVEPSVLLGFLLSFPKNSNYENFREVGNKKMEERKKYQKEKKKLVVEEFTTADILKLFEVAKEKNIDIFREMQLRFKKNLIQNLSFKEFEFLRDFLEI